MLCQFCKGQHGQDEICPLDPQNYDEPEINVKAIVNDTLREIVEQAHMAGQIDAGIDPSYSSARVYYNELFDA